jgi:hypothetical protein
VLATLDALTTALYVQIDGFLPSRTGPGHPPKLSDSETITLAVCQMLMGLPNDRQFLALAVYRLGPLFPYLPQQSGYNKRVRRLAPQIAACISHLATVSPSFGENVRLLDTTPVPCGQSRETTRRSQLAGRAAYGYCASHSRHFWGFRLYLLCAADGMPIRYELFPANTGERDGARQMLEGLDLAGYTVLADKGFAGEEFEQFMASLHAHFQRPDRRNETPRFGSLGAMRQWIESVIWTCKGPLALERHGARTDEGLAARVALRLLALAPRCGTTNSSVSPDATSRRTTTDRQTESTI